jgi:hypothetical protein
MDELGCPFMAHPPCLRYEQSSWLVETSVNNDGNNAVHDSDDGCEARLSCCVTTGYVVSELVTHAGVISQRRPRRIHSQSDILVIQMLQEKRGRQKLKCRRSEKGRLRASRAEIWWIFRFTDDAKWRFQWRLPLSLFSHRITSSSPLHDRARPQCSNGLQDLGE